LCGVDFGCVCRDGLRRGPGQFLLLSRCRFLAQVTGRGRSGNLLVCRQSQFVETSLAGEYLPLLTGFFNEVEGQHLAIYVIGDQQRSVVEAEVIRNPPAWEVLS